MIFRLNLIYRIISYEFTHAANEPINSKYTNTEALIKSPQNILTKPIKMQ